MIELLIGLVPPEHAETARELAEYVREAAKAHGGEMWLRGFDNGEMASAALNAARAAEERAAAARREVAHAWRRVSDRWLARILSETPQTVH